MMDIVLDSDCKHVKIERRRWDVTIYLTMPNGKKEIYVASADSFFTESDGIWFNTKTEMDKFK